MKKLLFLIKCLVLSLLLISCDTTGPKITPSHDKILFTSKRSGINQLYIVDPSGANIKQITSGEFDHSNGRWSSDAQKIICNTEEHWDIINGWLMIELNYDGSDETLLTYGREMSWHPNGTSILFTNWPGGGIIPRLPHLYRMNDDGTNVVKISDNFAGSNSFSPDGNNIIFAYNSDTLNTIVILDYPQLNNPVYIGPPGSGYPAWSPGGNEIAFSHSTDTSASDIYLMNIDGSNLQNVTNHVTKEQYYLPRWSPKGDKIIFIGYVADGSQKSYLYMVNKDGTDLHKLIGDDFVTSCDWSN